MTSDTIIELLKAAGYKIGHTHLPPWLQVAGIECCLVVQHDTNHLPPLIGLLEHLETEEPDASFPETVKELQNKFALHHVADAPGGNKVYIYMSIAVECPSVRAAKQLLEAEVYGEPVSFMSPGSSASN